jgi:hypothetical protein
VNSDDWDARYREAAEGRATVWSLEPNEWVVEALAGVTPGVAVDLAAGEGRNALAAGAARAEQLGVVVSWQKADATTWAAAEPVDLVLIAYLQLPRAELARVIRNAASALAPGGTLALIAHDRANTVGGPKDPDVLTTVAELTDAATGLDIVDCRQRERVTSNGTALDTVLIARSPG